MTTWEGRGHLIPALLLYAHDTVFIQGVLTAQAISQALLLMGGVQPSWNNWTVNSFVPPAASVVLGDPVRPGTFPWGLRVPLWCVRRPQP